MKEQHKPFYFGVINAHEYEDFALSFEVEMVPEVHMFNAIKPEYGYKLLPDSLDTDSYAMKSFLEDAIPKDVLPMMQPRILN